MALAIFGVWMAAGAGAQVGLSFFYALPTALACWWLGTRVGLAFALGCTGLYALGVAFHPVDHFVASLLLRLVAMLAVVAFVAVVRERMLALEHSAEELEEIRGALAPPLIEAPAGIEAGAAFIPSELGVSGDFYLLTGSPDGSAIAVVGDVVGHGPQAARLATFIRTRLATFAANSSNPAEILTLANESLMRRPGRRQDLVSAVCLRLHPGGRTLSWAVAGHPPPLRLPHLDLLPTPGETLLLGVRSDLSLSTAEVPLGRGDGILVYTDGATDIKVEGGGTLGLEGLRRLLEPLADRPAERLVREVEESLLEVARDTIRDDVCVLALRAAPS